MLYYYQCKYCSFIVVHSLQLSTGVEQERKLRDCDECALCFCPYHSFKKYEPFLDSDNIVCVYDKAYNIYCNGIAVGFFYVYMY